MGAKLVTPWVLREALGAALLARAGIEVAESMPEEEADALILRLVGVHLPVDDEADRRVEAWFNAHSTRKPGEHL